MKDFLPSSFCLVSVFYNDMWLSDWKSLSHVQLFVIVNYTVHGIL